MPRLPLLPEAICEPREVVDAMRARRGGTLRPIDRLILHSPSVAAGWTAHADAALGQTIVPVRLRELATVATSVLMAHDYEVRTHEPAFLAAGGTPEQFTALADVEAARHRDDLFDETERATLGLAIEMSRDIDVSDQTFARIADALPDSRSLVELITIIATYHMTNRVQRALDFC
ncbi:carboxymuconolactone decarboxylase family protein [Paracoccus versutus]|uniref:Alkylhydroperoxidase family enzyme n=1 Tax=Paracoccus versutus TaxID=34007 RepID=A0A3D9XSL5_PARVE|nr:carboxymuconolactone decarboxylase family protein [Paracoccus versutus]REF73336.1 alkylhydroperoxidase family enzyme [Paracoccus versutus]WGR54641.1 carboxymuconolactone decarboxylase family protein [Paracoccus versutus]